MFLSFLFCYAGKVESVNFDKETNHFSMCKTTILCRSNARIFQLSDVRGVRALCRGHSGVNVYTIHYKIIVELADHPSVKILETQSKKKVKRQVSISAKTCA